MGMILSGDIKEILKAVAMSIPVILFVWYWVERKRTPQAANYILVAALISIFTITAWLPNQQQEINQSVKTGFGIGDVKVIRVGAKSKRNLAVFREKAALDEFLNATDANDSQRLILCIWQDFTLKFLMVQK